MRHQADCVRPERSDQHAARLEPGDEIGSAAASRQSKDDDIRFHCREIDRHAFIFRGRNLDNEARRFLSLTRYGQSRAVSEGVPVELWINPRQGSYGLQALSGYTETQTNPMNFNLDESVQISFSAPSSVLVRSNYWTQAKAQFGAVAKIRFQPDGFISDSSPEKIFLRQGTASQILIAETPSHLRYDIQPSH